MFRMIVVLLVAFATQASAQAQKTTARYAVVINGKTVKTVDCIPGGIVRWEVKTATGTMKGTGLCPAPVAEPVPCPDCPKCPELLTSSAPMVKVDLNLNFGGIGYADFTNVFGNINLGVEFRLTQSVGVIIDADFGGGGGVIEDPGSSVWSTGVGVALWATDHARVVLGAGYRGVRNASWNFSVGGPQGFIDARFLLGDDGFSLGTRLASGPMWDYEDQLDAGWEWTVGLGWIFGGPRQ